MLNYEKKMHLDKAWDKMQKESFSKSIFQIIINALTYFVMFLLFKWLLIYTPDLCFWDKSPVLFSFLGLSFQISDIAYFAFGLVIYLYGSIRFIGINKQNHSVRNNTDIPSELLTNGYYAKVRHPMYGAFVIRASAVLLSQRSLIGVVFTILFAVSQYLNAAREEKKVLIPQFGEKYIKYIHISKEMVMRKWEIAIIIIWILTGIIGLII